MPKTPAAEVASRARGDRAVRVSSPDRVIYEATERTPEVTKLMVAQYFASVRRRADARPARPADRARALDLRRPAGHEARHRTQDQDADAFYQKRVPKGAPDYLESVEITFPSRAARPTRSARPRSRCRSGAPTWAPSPSTPGRSGAHDRPSTAPTSCGSTSTPSPVRRSPTPCGSPGSRASCSRSSASGAIPRPVATAASTSSCGSSRGGSSSTSATPRSVSAASSRAATTA